MKPGSRIYVAGHTGLVGSALVRRLQAEGCGELLLRTHAELDLTEQAAVREFFAAEQPEYVFLAAARVGGIMANSTRPADFIGQNLMIQCNVIDAAREYGVAKLLFLGSSCIYPKLAPQPIPESALLSSGLEPTNEWYAVAKIAGLKMCQAYHRQHGLNAISVMPANLYGPGDNYDLQGSHVLPAMVRKFHEAKEADNATVTLWGSGAPKREFMYVDDLADACVFLMRSYESDEIINVGTGEEVTIRKLAGLVQEAVGHTGGIVWDDSKPDGTPRKLLDVSRLQALGWQAKTPLREGLRLSYASFRATLG